MRAGFSDNLRDRLRRADPAAREIVEAIVVDREDLKRTKADWDAADSTVGLTPDIDGSVRIADAATINLQNTVQNAFYTDLNRASPFTVAKVTWNTSTHRDVELSSVRAYLDPANGGAKQVTIWRAQIFALLKVDFVGGEGGGEELLTLAPLHAPIDVTAGASAGDVTFTFPTPGPRPRPKALGPPIGGGREQKFPDPITYLFIWAIKGDGEAAANVGWGKDSGTSSVTGTDGKLEAVVLTENTNGKFEETAPSPGGVFTCRFAGNAYAANATISFTQTGPDNRLDLGATPTNTVEFMAQASVPAGASVVFQVRNDADAAWVTFVDGNTTDDLTGVGKNQFYKVRATLNSDAGGRVTPVLWAMGVRELTITDLDNVAEVRGDPVWGVDPFTLEAETTRCLIQAVRDGEQDFEDAITDLAVTTDIGGLEFRVLIGHPDLARGDWLLHEHYIPDDIVAVDGGFAYSCHSVLAELHAVLPVYDSVNSKRASYSQVNQTLKAVWDDIVDNQLALAKRRRGPGVEDNTTQISKDVENSDVKTELHAVAYVDGSANIASQGRIKSVKMLAGETATVAIFPASEIVPLAVSPGFAERVNEFFIRFDYDLDTNTYEGEVRSANPTGIAKLGRGRVLGVQFLPDSVSGWIDTSTLADTVAARVTRQFGTGKIMLRFRSQYAQPELEPGDEIAVETTRFAVKDPHTARAIRGHVVAFGRLVTVQGTMGRDLTLWVRSFADLLTVETSIDRTDFARPEIISIVPSVAGNGDLSVTITTREALAVKVAVSATAFPTKATVQAASTDPTDPAEGIFVSGVLLTLASGAVGYISALAYEKLDGTGSESTQMSQSKIQYVPLPQQTTNEIDGFSAAQNAAAPENGTVALTNNNDVAYSNLEDANVVATTYVVTFDAVIGTLTAIAELKLYYNDAPGSTTWTLAATTGWDSADNGNNYQDLTMQFSAALNADFDLRLQLTYTNPGADGGQVTVTAGGEDSSPPGVQYAKVSSSVLPGDEVESAVSSFLTMGA